MKPKPKVVQRPKKLKQALGRDLIQVFTDNDGSRKVWFLGYGFRDRSSELGYTWVHYYYNIVPLDIFLSNTTKMTSADFNREYNRGREPYREEIDKFDARYYYSDADTEAATPFLDYSDEIKDGYYIV